MKLVDWVCIIKFCFRYYQNIKHPRNKEFLDHQIWKKGSLC